VREGGERKLGGTEFVRRRKKKRETQSADARFYTATTTTIHINQAKR